MEYWVEVNLFAKSARQNEILLNVLKPHVDRLRKEGVLVTWHFFREPEIRFRVRLSSKPAKLMETRRVAALANSLRERGLISNWHFGNHGDANRAYVGEQDRYGQNGWKVAQDYFNLGSEIALRLLALRTQNRLENPLWGRGLGNPWEGGIKNPWRERQKNPIVYHWSRYVHLFTNQLGFEINDEVRLCSRQADRYRRVMKEIGMKW